jgi:hypothetical protein
MPNQHIFTRGSHVCHEVKLPHPPGSEGGGGGGRGERRERERRGREGGRMRCKRERKKGSRER